MAGAFNKKAQKRLFNKEDLVLAVKRPMIITHKSKGIFEEKWEEPYVVDTVYSNGAYGLLKKDGDPCMMPKNGKFLNQSSR